MNILYLAHRIPYPPDKGDKLRAFRQIERLSRRHRVWCACFVDDPRDFRHVQKLRSHCVEVGTVGIKPHFAKIRGLVSLARGKTITEGFYSSREMAALLDHWQKSTQFDAVVAFSSSMAIHALSVPAGRRILDLCDLDSLKWSDYAGHIELSRKRSFKDRLLVRLYRKESTRLAAAELRWIDGFDAALLATETEAAPLRGLISSRKLHVVGNGVTLSDLDSAVPTGLDSSHHSLPSDESLGYSQRVPTGRSALSGSSYKRGSLDCDSGPVIGFVGVMDYLPNVDAVSWFVSESWPVIQRRFPKATFRIVGRSPTQAVRKLGRIQGVQVVGEVADVGSELARFDVSVAPLRIARGIQNKVLEAMAATRPVVLTGKAANGIAAVDGRDYLVADAPAHFAEAVCSLLADQEEQTRIGTSGRKFVMENRRWEPELAKLEAIVANMEPRTSARSAIPALPLLPTSDRLSPDALTVAVDR